jgi:hypothetical protein
MMERFSHKVYEFSKVTLVNMATGQPWVVPEQGVLRVDFTYEVMPPAFNQVRCSET